MGHLSPLGSEERRGRHQEVDEKGKNRAVPAVVKSSPTFTSELLPFLMILTCLAKQPTQDSPIQHLLSECVWNQSFDTFCIVQGAIESMQDDEDQDYSIPLEVNHDCKSYDG